MLSAIISRAQAALISGKQIVDGVLVANECLHSRHRDKSSGLICKLDPENANDKVN